MSADKLFEWTGRMVLFTEGAIFLKHFIYNIAIYPRYKNTEILLESKYKLVKFLSRFNIYSILCVEITILAQGPIAYRT